MSAPAAEQEPTGMVPARMLTIGRVAEILDCSYGTAKNLILSGAIPSVKIGRLRRVREPDLAEWLRSRPTEAPTPGSISVA